MVDDGDYGFRTTRVDFTMSVGQYVFGTAAIATFMFLATGKARMSR